MKAINARLLLGLISIGGILSSCQVKTDWREKPLASDLQFTQLARSWDEGIPLGNATVGALLWQRDSALRFSLDRTDLWDLRPMDSISGSNNRFSWVYSQVQKGDYLPVQKKYDWPYDQLPAPSKIPGAALEFPLEKLGEPNDIRLYLNNALCEARWDNGTTLKTFVHATEPVGWFVFENLPDTICPSLIAPQYNKPVAAGDNDPVTGLDLRRLGYEQGTLRTEKQQITYHQPGWGRFYYDVNVRWKQKGKKLYGVWSVSSSLSSDKASEATLQALERGVDAATVPTWTIGTTIGKPLPFPYPIRSCRSNTTTKCTSLVLLPVRTLLQSLSRQYGLPTMGNFHHGRVIIITT